MGTGMAIVFHLATLLGSVCFNQKHFPAINVGVFRDWRISTDLVVSLTRWPVAFSLQPGRRQLGRGKMGFSEELGGLFLAGP